MENLDKLIEYWDDVIRRWFDGDIDKEQQLFFDFKNRKYAYVLNLSKEDMPEPYWGNPKDCSVVIANYNPGGGGNKDKHTYRGGKLEEKTLIGEVKKSGYSKVALGFPLIVESGNGECCYIDYDGSKWWKPKRRWLENYIFPAIDCAENFKDKKPFAIEFCAWHSVEWPRDACSRIYKNEALKSVVDKYFIDVLTDAVKHSESKLGICVGAQFYRMFQSKGMTPIKCFQHEESSKYYLYLFEINGAKILSVWGIGNRYPKIDSSKLKELLK